MATSAATNNTGKSASYSIQQRERGNTFYKSATDNFGCTIRLLRLDNALTCYRNALDWKSNEDEEVSAMKNIGMTSWKLAGVYFESAPIKEAKVGRGSKPLQTSSGSALLPGIVQFDGSNPDVNIQKYFKEALKNLGLAYKNRFCKSLQWGHKLEDYWEDCLKEAREWLDTLDTKERISGFSELLSHAPDCRLKANGYIQYATLLFHEGVTAWQNGEYKECYRYMKECYYPIQEADRMSSQHPFIKTEVNILREDVYIHTCMAESIMARVSGDSLLNEGLNEQETINTDAVWTVIDFYKEAAVLCRDRDLEQEAIAYSRLGHVFGKVLKLSSQGKDYYKKAIQLALSMTPRTFYGVDWFKESTEFVKDFQKRLNKDGEEDKEKEAALKEMKDDVDKLTKMVDAMADDVEFVKELYVTWPPKAPGAEFDDKLSKRKLLLKAVSHYHPDKVDKEIHGKNWFYFSGEITKELNIRYSRYKGVD